MIAGITLRDYIATHAGDLDVLVAQNVILEGGFVADTHASKLALRARARYAFADAMLKERGVSMAAPDVEELKRKLQQRKCDYAALAKHHNKHCTCNEIY